MQAMERANLLAFYMDRELDGYRREGAVNYCSEALDFHFSDSCERRNKAISRALHELGKRMDIRFLTPSLYEKEASIHG